MSSMCQVGEQCGCGFKNTGMKYGEVWDNIHKLIDEQVGCEECNVHGHWEIDGVRDHIKVGIGGVPYDQKHYKKWVDEVNCTFDKCVADGRCQV